MTTVAEMLDKYIEECGPEMAPRTLKDYKAMLPRLKEAFGDKDVDAVEPRDVGQFLNVRQGKISANRHIVILSAAYSQAVGRWWLAKSNPCLRVLRNPSKPRTRYITDKEYDAFRARLPAMYQIAMDLALLTGQRQGDLLALKWKDVDGYDKLVYFEQAKTGKRLAIRVTPALEAVLVRAKAHEPHWPKSWVIHDGTPFSPEGFRACWQRYMRAWREEGNEPFHFHDIRAKSASDSSTLDKAYERLGHTSPAMTRRVYDRGTRVVDPLR